MRFKAFINEGIYKEKISNESDLIKLLKTNCSVSWKEWNKNEIGLFRGSGQKD